MMFVKKATRAMPFAACIAAVALSCAGAARVEVYPQGFDAGGWVLDAQFMDVMGSPYLLAHGLGVRVTDAKARVAFPTAGEYRVWVRTRNWADGAPGRFRVLVDGKPLTGGPLPSAPAKEFGAGSRDGMTLEAEHAIAASDLIVGYTVYVGLLKPFFPEKAFLCVCGTAEL